jgi:hypothetical protein
MPEASPLTIDCETHGDACIAAVVCGHMIDSRVSPVGFVENSDDPNDLQAWCEDCEEMFLREDDKTEAFRAFNRMTVVCAGCYQELKSRHSRKYNT